MKYTEPGEEYNDIEASFKMIENILLAINSAAKSSDDKRILQTIQSKLNDSDVPSLCFWSVEIQL
jgi:hypothetical protein